MRTLSGSLVDGLKYVGDWGDGKLLCCCEECCLYIGDNDWGDGSDLPDTVTVNGVSKTRSGTGYGDTTDGVILESGVWAVYVAGVRTTQSCLVNGVVEDEFPSTVTMTSSLIIPPGYTTLIDPVEYWTGEGHVPADIELTRTSLCCWTSTVSIPFYWVQTSEYIANYDLTFSVCYDELSASWKFAIVGSVMLPFFISNWDIFTEGPVTSTLLGEYSSSGYPPLMTIE